MKKFALILLALVLAMATFGAMALASETEVTAPDPNDAGHAEWPNGHGSQTAQPNICSHTTTHEQVAAYPTCTETGMVRIICSDCQKVVASTVVDALNHNWQLEDEEYVAATCTTGAVHTLIYKCHNTGCDKTYSATGSKTGGPLGHDWHLIRNVEQPDCENVGYDLYKCLRCEIYETRTISALGHLWGQTQVTPATCTEAGQEVTVCLRCGKANVKVLPALGHQWSAWHIDISPKCEANGIRSRYCTRDCCIEGNLKTTAYETEIIQAHGHMYDETRATVNADGSKSVRCVYCSKNLSVPAPTPAPTPEPAVEPAADPASAPAEHNTTGGSSNTTGGSSNTSGGSRNTPSTNSRGVTIPATGDNADNLPFVMIAVAVTGLAALALSKRRVNG